MLVDAEKHLQTLFRQRSIELTLKSIRLAAILSLCFILLFMVLSLSVSQLDNLLLWFTAWCVITIFLACAFLFFCSSDDMDGYCV